MTSNDLFIHNPPSFVDFLMGAVLFAVNTIHGFEALMTVTLHIVLFFEVDYLSGDDL